MKYRSSSKLFTLHKVGAEFLHIQEIDFFTVLPSSGCLKENNQSVIFFFDILLVRPGVQQCGLPANHVAVLELEWVTQKLVAVTSRLTHNLSNACPATPRTLINLDQGFCICPPSPQILHGPRSGGNVQRRKAIDLLPFGRSRSRSRHVIAAMNVCRGEIPHIQCGLVFWSEALFR